MKKILVLVALFSFLTMNAQDYYQKNIEAHEAHLGTEPEEFGRDGTASVYVNDQQIDIHYATIVVNMLHAIFSIEKTFFITDFDQYTELEKEGIEGMNGYCVQIDTVAQNIIDIEGNVICHFTGAPGLHNKIDSILSEIISQDIDVLPIGINESALRDQKVLNNHLVNRIYPNPTIGKVNIKLSGDRNKVSLKVFSEVGCLIKAYTIHANSQISLEALPKGTYFMLFESEGIKQVEKIMVK